MSTGYDHTEEPDNENFEELLEHSMNRRDDFEIGARVEGKIVFITNDLVFVDISGKSEAVIKAEEFRNDDGTLSVSQGDAVEAYVVSLSGGEIHLTTSLGRGAINTGLMQMAYREAIPVYGTVTDTVKGGFSISVSGIRCFCPTSQIDMRPPADPRSMVDRSFLFKIIEFKERGKNIVLSRTALQEEHRKETEESLRETLKTGDLITGTVSGIRDFGIFVDIGGLEALVPKSEISRGRSVNTGAFSVGEKIEAIVKSIDWESRRLTLSIRDLTPEPWEHIDRYQVGQTVSGRVINLIKNGAFVEIEPGLDGFIHVSRMSYLKKINRPEDAVSVGDTANVRITGINPNEKKISLELIHDGPDPWKESGDGMANTIQRVTIEDVKPAGLSVRLANGMLGFIPRGELMIKNESEIQKKYPAGSEITAAVLRIEQENRKLILSESEAIKLEERKDYESFIKKDAASKSTTLGSMLKNKFEDIQKKIEK
ncbi:MAG: S1 RNA-binding domain-containing protein [Spirochaetes bacterium]|nr:S1 RNA-binding domain-containing protein [Spirochaetota bacterium]